MNPSFLIEIGVRLAILLAAALLAVGAMRRRSAGERHFILVLALTAAVLLPGGYLALPSWAWRVSPAVTEQIPMRMTATVGDISNRPAAGSNADAPVARSRSDGLPFDSLLAVLVVGAMAQAGWLALGAWHLHGIRRRCRRFDLPAEITAHMQPCPEILLSEETRVAFLAGSFRPAIVLPAGADAWPSERLRMVLCHEFAHLRRRDHWAVLLGNAVRVLYWWHPLAWAALARLRKERERACDDIVVGYFRATDYAELLVLSARAAGAGRRPQLAMAAPLGIESRVRAILDGSLSRRGMTRRAAWGFAMAAAGAMGLASVVRLVAAESSAPPAVEGKVVGGSFEDSTPRPADRTGEKDIQVETKIVEMSAAAAEELRAVLDPVMAAKGAVSNKVFQACIRALDQKRGVDLMSAPTVTVRGGRKATVAITREFRYGVDYRKNAAGKLAPTRFDKRDLGVLLEVQPVRVGDRIVLNGLMRLTEFEGGIKGEDGVEMPVFDVKEARFLREAGDGQSVGIWTFDRADEQAVTDRLPDGTEKQSHRVVMRRIAVFLTARLTDAASAAAATPTPQSPPPVAVSSNLPYGTPVAGKSGFVASPYAPDKGSVDVRGFPPNTEVKCPYSGKIFLVP